MNSPAWKNKLYYGDNLDVLREYVNDESVDLVYLDPPFNSNATYNVLFKEKDGSLAASQLQAFEDTWEWDQNAANAFEEMVEHGPTHLSDALQAFRTLLGPTNMLAYLAMMAPRLIELRRILKPTGSLFLHCDPTASHYLKLLLDAIFRPEQFRNEILWKRTHSHGNVARTFGTVCDTVFFYSKDHEYKWNKQFLPLRDEYVRSKFRSKDDDGRLWQGVTLRNPGVRPNLRYPYTASNGVTYQPHPNGWSCDLDRMEKYDREGRLYFPKPGGQLRLKMYLDESRGVQIQNLWDDIPALNSQAQERLGYPTQKPEAFLERIIKATTDEGDLVLDAFCGCGTAIAAAETLNRRWIGIDITQAAMVVIKQQRLSKIAAATYEVIGEPVSIPDAEALANEEPYQFQWWAVGRLSAHPVERKKGGDRGIDGRLDFHDDHRETKKIMISVKAGHLLPQHVRELRGVIEREKAQMGVLVSREKPTKAMRAEAASAGVYRSPWRSKPYPRIQLINIADLFSEHPIEMPGREIAENVSFKKGPQKERRRGLQGDLFKKQG